VKVLKLSDMTRGWFIGIDSSVVHLAQSLDVKRGVLHASTPTPPKLNPNSNWSMKEYS